VRCIRVNDDPGGWYVYVFLRGESKRPLISAAGRHGTRKCSGSSTASAPRYLKEHQADSPKTYQAALDDTEDFDGAAAVLIQRLQDPHLRADVQTAINKVGRIESFNLRSDKP
jgi:hypothetical protein